MSYCCTRNVASIIKSHNKKLINTSIKKYSAVQLQEKSWVSFRLYKYVASVDRYPNKIYLDTAEGDFKQRFYNHRMSFNNEGHPKDTTLLFGK